MLKKIIAAAAASTLAVSALAATASAAPAQVVFEGWDIVDTVTVTVKGEVANLATELSLVAPALPAKEPKENYSSIEVSLFSNITGDAKITSGTIGGTLVGSTSAYDIGSSDWGSEKEKTSKAAEATIAETTLKNGKEVKGTVKFDLGATDYVKIVSFDDSKSKLTFELTMDLTEDQFNSLVGSGKLVGTKLTDSFTEALGEGAVAVSSAPFSVKAKTKGAEGNVPAASSWKISAAKVNTKKTIPFTVGMAGDKYDYTLNDYAADWSRKDLRQFMNGGTMEFVFNKAVGGKDWVDGAVTFTNSNLQNKTVETDYTEETNTVSVQIPVNFSYSDNTNTYPWTDVAWQIQKKPGDGLKDLEIVKIVFTANETAPGNNGGLVEDDNNKPANSDSTPSSTPSTPSNTNSGSSGNDNKNPSTGVAVAVAPVALAAAAAAVVISKKRK